MHLFISVPNSIWRLLLFQKKIETQVNVWEEKTAFDKRDLKKIMKKHDENTGKDMILLSEMK